MNLPDKIEVVITPRDVLTTERYTDIHDCALCKAIRRKTKANYICAGTGGVAIGDTKNSSVDYMIIGEFTNEHFNSLRSRAESGERFKEKITLTKIS